MINILRILKSEDWQNNFKNEPFLKPFREKSILSELPLLSFSELLGIIFNHSLRITVERLVESQIYFFPNDPSASKEQIRKKPNDIGNKP